MMIYCLHWRINVANKDVQLAIVVSQFNQLITDKLLQGALARLRELNFAEHQLTIIKVPGAVEIPLTAKLLAKTKKYQAIICLGAVIRGETSHYDYVCKQVSDGCQQVMMTFDVPVIFGILTTENGEQAHARTGGLKGHKGIEAVDAAITMMSVLKEIG